jgi:imidazoleglycerol phosphate dehydratase HisB
MELEKTKSRTGIFLKSHWTKLPILGQMDLEILVKGFRVDEHHTILRIPLADSLGRSFAKALEVTN